MTGFKILLIEDDVPAGKLIEAALAIDGHRATRVIDGREGLLRAAAEPWDLLIIDRTLPGIDGLAVVRTLRSASLNMPVLFLTTRDDIEERVEGLRAGGDDYLIKPFAVSELSARVTALVRRAPPKEKAPVLRVGDLELDRLSRRVSRAGMRIDLKPREYLLLEYLMRHPGQVVARTTLLEDIWNFNFDPGTSIVESHVSRLRMKIDRGFGDELLHTVRGAGYRMGDAI
jgi:two-component system, OmpR family, response regulator